MPKRATLLLELRFLFDVIAHARFPIPSLLTWCSPRMEGPCLLRSLLIHHAPDVPVFLPRWEFSSGSHCVNGWVQASRKNGCFVHVFLFVCYLFHFRFDFISNKHFMFIDVVFVLVRPAMFLVFHVCEWVLGFSFIIIKFSVSIYFSLAVTLSVCASRAHVFYLKQKCHTEFPAKYPFPYFALVLRDMLSFYNLMHNLA